MHDRLKAPTFFVILAAIRCNIFLRCKPNNTSLRASSYEPGNRAGPVGGTNFVFCSYGKFNPGYRDEKCPKGRQNTRGTAFRPVSDLTSHKQLKMFRPGIRAGVFIWEEFGKFPARLPRSRSQKPRSRLPGQPAFSYEHIEIFVKKRAARRDLGNRASAVNRAHMKRPLAVEHDAVLMKCAES